MGYFWIGVILFVIVCAFAQDGIVVGLDDPAFTAPPTEGHPDE